MEKFSAFDEIKISQIKPEGWPAGYLKAAKDGLPGHLHEIGYPFNTNCWSLKTLADGGYAQWWPYEQTAYWIDSVVRSACLLRDEEFLAVVKPQIDAAVSNAEEDGFIGPEELKGDGGRFQWPHAVFFRALHALFTATGDKKYADAMIRHYKTGYRDYSESRDVANIETILKLYEDSGDESLRELACSSFEKFCKTNNDDSNINAMASDSPLSLHGVSFNEQGKIAAVMYSYFGEKKYLDAVINGYEKVQRDHVMPDGVHSSCEGFRGKKIMDVAHETCDITDYTWALSYLLEATGDGKYADRIEKACLNASLGAIGPEFKTMQYFSNINQVIAARNSTHIDSFADTPRMAYQPHQYPECCVGNCGRAIPNYIIHSYYTRGENIFAALYGDSTFTHNGLIVKQSGGYPFCDTVRFEFSGDTKVTRDFSMRIPQWCSCFEIRYNGELSEIQPENGFAKLSGEFKDGDVVEITLQKELRSFESAEGGIWFEYGPLVLSLKIDEEWSVDESEPRQTEAFPAYNIRPASEFAYVVTGNEKCEIVKNRIGDNPWWQGYPYEIRICARKLNNWDIEVVDIPANNTQEGIDDKQIALGATRITDNQLELTPRIPDSSFVNANIGDEEIITLVPYGCTQLRLTVFPRYEEK